MHIDIIHMELQPHHVFTPFQISITNFKSIALSGKGDEKTMKAVQRPNVHNEHCFELRMIIIATKLWTSKAASFQMDTEYSYNRP